MNKISVFGGTGFIGSAFVKTYPKKTIVVDREQADPPTDNILWFISTTDNYNVFGDLQKDVDTNLKKLLQTLEHCKNRPVVFNFISSWFVYGNVGNLPASETTPCNPTGFYSITKRCAEQLLISFCQTHNIKYRILRLGNVYGYGDNKSNKKKNAIQWMISQLIDNKPVELYEDGYVVRDLLYIDDAVDAIHHVIKNSSHNTITNIGNGKPTSVRYIIDYAKKYCKSDSNIVGIPTPEFHKQVQARDFWLDTSKLNLLGWYPKITIEEGLEKLIKDIKNNA